MHGAFWDRMGRQNCHVGFVSMKPVNCCVPLCTDNFRNSPNPSLVVILSPSLPLTTPFSFFFEKAKEVVLQT